MPLCDALDCVPLHNEGFHGGLLSLRRLLVRPTLLGISILVSLSVVWLCASLVTVTRYFSSRVLMTFSLSLVIVTCFAMSFALRSAAIARLILDASLLHCTRELPTLLNFAVQSFFLSEDSECLHFSFFCFCELVFLLDEACTRCGYESSLAFLLVAVHSLSAECGRLC